MTTTSSLVTSGATATDSAVRTKHATAFIRCLARLGHNQLVVATSAAASEGLEAAVRIDLEARRG